MYGYYQSWVSHVGNRRCEHRATETDLVVLLFVRIFVGGRILSMKQMALARSFIKPERQLHVQIHRINAVATLVIMTM